MAQQNSDNVKDFSQISRSSSSKKTTKTTQRVEMQRPSGNQGPLDSSNSCTLSKNTIQREERQNLLASHGEGDDNLTDFEEEDDFRDNLGRRGRQLAGEDEATSQGSAPASNGHWLWSNWILLALLGVFSFALCNLLIGELSSKGVESMNYYCSGSLVFSIAYFLYQKEWAKLNPTSRGLLDADAMQEQKVLLRTRDTNQFDWHSLVIVFCGAAFQAAIFFSIIVGFNMSKKAGLNIGISQAIWSVNPFLCSLVERCVYGVAFDRRQFFGMSALIACAIFVSLSEVFNPPTEEAIDAGSGTEETDTEAESTPIWVAVLCSFAMPCVCAAMLIVIKHANETLNIAAKDFSIGYFFVLSFVFQIVGICSFLKNEGSFDMTLFVDGFLASFFNLLGCVFAISSF